MGTISFQCGYYSKASFIDTIKVIYKPFFDSGDIKCERYWPDVSKSLIYDHMEIKTLDETEAVENELILRKLQIESK